MSEDKCFHTYTLKIWGPGPIRGYERDNSGEFQPYDGLAPSLIEETMDNVTDLLPQGYTAEVTATTEEKT